MSKATARIFLDVREPFEYASGHVKGALNLPPAALMQGLPPALESIPKDTEIILYCLSGARSNSSIQLLRRYGFTNLINGISKGRVEAAYF